MSRSVQTMTRMPFDSVVACTCSMPGTRLVDATLGGAACAMHDRTSALSAQETRNFCMCELYTQKRKAPHAGEVACGAKKRTPGKSCSQFLVRTLLREDYLEARVARIAASCARASRASMGA